MASSPHNRWLQLLDTAERLSSVSRAGKRSKKDPLPILKQALSNLEFAFPRELDPVDEFEAYALRRFILALIDLSDELPARDLSTPHSAN